MEDLMRPNVSDEWGIRDLQNCILNIAKYIHNFCEKHGIKYCIMGGTALGAVRHGGFIPWDDDLDIFMPPADYEKFRRLFLQEGDHANYYLQEWGQSKGKVSSAKLRYNHSSYVEECFKDWDIHHGIYVDIFIMNDCPNTIASIRKMVFWSRYLAFKSFSLRGYKKRGKIIELFFDVMKVIIPKRLLLDHAISQIYSYHNCDWIFHYYPSKALSCSIYPKVLFDKCDFVNFETIQLRCPQGVKEYLGLLFGNYMKMPDIKQIKHQQHAWEWRVDKDFSKRKKGCFADEKYLV